MSWNLNKNNIILINQDNLPTIFLTPMREATFPKPLDMMFLMDPQR